MKYVVAYDIANPKRLRRVARVMERRATRCQKSVFIFRGDQAGLQELLDEIAPLLKPEEDIVQAWKAGNGKDAAELSRGTPNNIYPASIVIESRKHWSIKSRKPQDQTEVSPEEEEP